MAYHRLATEGHLTEAKRSADSRSILRGRSLGLGSGFLSGLTTTTATVARMAAVACMATVARMAAVAGLAAATTSRTTSTQAGQQALTMAAMAGVAGIATVAARIAGRGTMAATATTGHRGVLASQHGNADNGEENRDRKSQFPIHPRFLQIQVP